MSEVQAGTGGGCTPGAREPLDQTGPKGANTQRKMELVTAPGATLASSWRKPSPLPALPPKKPEGGGGTPGPPTPCPFPRAKATSRICPPPLPQTPSTHTHTRTHTAGGASGGGEKRLKIYIYIFIDTQFIFFFFLFFKLLLGTINKTTRRGGVHVLVCFYLCSILGGGRGAEPPGLCRRSDCPLHIYTFLGGDFYFYFSLSASFKGSILQRVLRTPQSMLPPT